MSSDNLEKKKALQLAIAHIQKQFGDGSIMSLGQHPDNQGVDIIKSGAISLDIAMGIGGVPRGRIVEIYGPESSGKSTLALHIVANAQKTGGLAAYIDAEHAIAHSKVMIIDKQTVITGSFNFTKAAEEKNAENLLIIRSEVLASYYLENWQKHREHSKRYGGKY